MMIVGSATTRYALVWSVVVHEVTDAAAPCDEMILHFTAPSEKSGAREEVGLLTVL